MRARAVRHLDPGARLDENGARIVSVRLDEMLSLAPKATRKPTARKAQHDMRIAAKRLRYVLEVTGFCFGRPAEVARRRARDLQDVLGEIHDCDVMLPRVQAQIERMRSADASDAVSRAGQAPDLDPRIAAEAPHRTAYRGLEVLAVYLEARRRILFDRFLRFWEAQRKQGTWLRLGRAVESLAEEARLRREADLATERAVAAREAADRAAREGAARRGTAASMDQAAESTDGQADPRHEHQASRP